MDQDLTRGKIGKSLIKFATPMILGNILQIFYNIVDSIIVGRVIGPDALAQVGSAFTIMTFLTSIIIGLCMGSAAVFSYYFGQKRIELMKNSVQFSFLFIGIISLIIMTLSIIFVDDILIFMRIPGEIYNGIKNYITIIFYGIFFIFLYNFFAFLLRSKGNSVVPLIFLAIAALINVVLDIYFVVFVKMGVEGAAFATIIAQLVAGVGLLIYTYIKEKEFRISLKYKFDARSAKHVIYSSFAASIQQSIMNFGILLVQGLVNSFGANVMAAFAAGVKIDAFAYMPAQEFGNAYSLFISQNHGAGKIDRVKEGTKTSIKMILGYCLVVSILIVLFSKQFIMIFIGGQYDSIINIGIGYLRIEGILYAGIGILFLLYGYFRGIQRPEISLLLTVISLGLRVILAYILSGISSIGILGIWAAIPIGWIVADIIGIILIKKGKH